MCDRRVIAAARSAAVVMGLGFAASAFGAGYASGVAESSGIVNFILNQNNSNVTIVRDGTPESLGALNLGPQSFSRNGAANYSIVVSAGPADGYLSIVGATAGSTIVRDGTLQGGTLQVSDDNNSRNGFNSPRAVTVNTNPANGSLFGRVYVANSNPGTTGGFPIAQRTAGDGIYVNDAAGGDPLAQGDVELTAGINFTAGGASSPWRLALDADGFVYIGDWSDAAGTVHRTDPNVTTGGNLFVGVGASGPTIPSNTLNHGSVTGIFVSGSAAAGNLTVYTADEDLSPTGTADQLNSIWRYNLGSTTADFDGIPDLLGNNVLIDTLATGGIIVDMTRNKADGKFYISQSRANGTEVGVAVFANDGTTLLYDSLQDSIALGLDGNPALDGVQDVLRTTQAIEVSPDGKYLAVQRNNSDAMIVPLIDGLPDLVNAILLDAFDNVNSGRSISFDAANNVYILTSGNQGMRVFSPGGPTETTYNSDGTFRSRIGPDFNGTGNYSDSSKWLQGVVPSAPDAYATVGNVTGGTQTLTVDSPVQLGRLTLAGGNYTVSGSSIQMGAGLYEPRIVAEAGNHTVSAPLDVQKNVGYAANTGASLTVTNPTYANPQLTITKFGGGTVTHPGISQETVRIRAGTLKLATGSTTSKVTSLSIAAGSTLDLGNNAFIVDYVAGDSPLATIQAQIVSGRNGGNWAGAGITSSAAAAAPGLFGVGFAEASDLGLTNFAGVPVDGDAVVFRYTRLGDADLSGTVSLDDFTALASNFGGTGSWIQGDFNFDGNINLDDFTPLAANFGLSAGDAPRGGAVPEPGAISLIAAAGMGLLRRRRA